jgi:RecA/RadA recombinase
VVELFSIKESEGKSTLAQAFEIQTQLGGGLVMHKEQETAMDIDRFERMGGDPSNMFITCPHSVEDGFITARSWLESLAETEFAEVPKLIVWDTIAAAPTRAEQGENMYADGMASKPRIIGQSLRGMVQLLYKCNATLLLVNQSYTCINSKLPFPVYEQPGGKGIKFYSSLRIEVKRCGYLAEAKTVKGGKEGQNTKTGILSEITTVKNKVAPPFRTVRVALEGPTGYNNPLTYAHWFMDTKETDMISGASGYYQIPGRAKKLRWGELSAIPANDPALAVWAGRALQRFPLPVDRQVNPATGWVEHIDGMAQFQSSGGGEREMTDEEVAEANKKAKMAAKKKAKKKAKKNAS